MGDLLQAQVFLACTRSLFLCVNLFSEVLHEFSEYNCRISIFFWKITHAFPQTSNASLLIKNFYSELDRKVRQRLSPSFCQK